MPYKSVVAQRKHNRETQRRKRKRDRENAIPAALPAAGETGDPVTDLCKWARDTLKVPAGHPLAGEPMGVPSFGERFLRDALTHRESLLTVSRKNAKSAIIAILLLGYLAGPLAVRGWRGAVASINSAKAGELKRQMQEIAEASDLRGLRFLRSPTPGRVEAVGGTLDILSADKSAGAASGFDLVVVDELGLLHERDRELIAGLKSSTSARNGRFIAISIYGSAPFIPEMIERAGDPQVSIHAYVPEQTADPTDPETWAQGNPGLGTIKPVEYMQDRARISGTNPSDFAFFRSEDCNIPGSPSLEMICTPSDWKRITDAPAAQRDGKCFIGLDAGGSSSMTAAAVVWPSTGRLEVYAAFPTTEQFGLHERGRGDAVGKRYETLHSTGELWTYHGRRTTPVVPFLADVRERLGDQEVAALGADRYRRSEIIDYMSDAGLAWPLIWRGQGASSTADGSADVRAFQKSVLDGWLRPVSPCTIMVHSIAESVIRRDSLGNPALDKARQAGRIDPLSAALIAVGLADRERSKPTRGYRSGIV